MKATYKQKLLQALTLITKQLPSIVSASKRILNMRRNLLDNIKNKLSLLFLNLIFEPINYLVVSVLITMISRLFFWQVMVYCSEPEILGEITFDPLTEEYRQKRMSKSGQIYLEYTVSVTDMPDIIEMPPSPTPSPAPAPWEPSGIFACDITPPSSTDTEVGKSEINTNVLIANKDVPDTNTEILNTEVLNTNTKVLNTNTEVLNTNTEVLNTNTDIFNADADVSNNHPLESFATDLIKAFKSIDYSKCRSDEGKMEEKLDFIVQTLPHDFFAKNEEDIGEEGFLMSELIKEIDLNNNADINTKAELIASLLVANIWHLSEYSIFDADVRIEIYNKYVAEFIDQSSE